MAYQISLHSSPLMGENISGEEYLNVGFPNYHKLLMYMTDFQAITVHRLFQFWCLIS